MIHASCHCGAVRMEIETPPDNVKRLIDFVHERSAR